MADVNSTKPDLLLVEQGGGLLHAQHGWASDFVKRYHCKRSSEILASDWPSLKTSTNGLSFALGSQPLTTVYFVPHKCIWNIWTRIK